MFMIALNIGVRLDVSDFQRRIAIDTARPDSSLIIASITIDTKARDIEYKREKCHLMGSKFRYHEKNCDNHYTDDEKWRCRYATFKFVKKTKSEYDPYYDNPHLTQTKVKNNGIFVFDLDRNLVLHELIVP